jgi:hypothetical protein
MVAGTPLSRTSRIVAPPLLQFVRGVAKIAATKKARLACDGDQFLADVHRSTVGAELARDSGLTFNIDGD